MKRILTLLLALCLLLFTACGAGEAAAPAAQSESKSVPETVPAPDFTLTDQFGEEHSLADYAGKRVFLNIWATWCGPCRDEMPEIQALYEDYGENGDDVVVLGLCFPYSEESRQTGEGTPEEVAAFMEENGYTYPTLMDTSGKLAQAYYVSAYPTTYVINKNGDVAGMVRGGMDRATMEKLLAMGEG